MKIIALDIGDVHTGVATADEFGLLARPLTTVATQQLMAWLQKFCKEQHIETVVVGYPKTLRNTVSQQTAKVTAMQEALAAQVTDVKWVLWDERLTSKQAQRIQVKRIKSDKNYEHAVAAALILQSYLEYLAFKS